MNKETIIKLNEQRSVKTLAQLSKEFNIPISTIRYWTNEEERKKTIEKNKEYFKNLSKSKKSEIYHARSPYISKWICNKYKTDPAFKKLLNEKRRKYGKGKKS